MGDGSGTKTGFIGKDTAGHALFHAHEEASDHTAGHGSGMESTFYNRSKYSRYSLNMEKDHTQCQHDIHDRHERNQLGGDIADPLDTADQDQGNDDRQCHADDQVDKLYSICRQYVKAAQSRINGSSDRVDLCSITGTEYGQHTESGEQIRQEVPFLSSPFLI